MSTLRERLRHSWNAFLGRDPTEYTGSSNSLSSSSYRYETTTYTRPDRLRLKTGNEKSIITAMYSRIAMDVAAIDIQHVKINENGSYTETVYDGLTNCLTVEANLDQTGRELVQDIVMSMFDEGVVAVVPIETDIDPNLSGSFDIKNLRTGKIVEWRPHTVKVLVYNENTGMKQELVVDKKYTAIIQNPLYYVMNEPNSTIQRLIRKLNLLDAIDEQSAAGKLDLIIQLPYVIKSEARKQQAEARRKDIEMQLTGTKYGIAYTDGTERITQLNRPIENNIMSQIEYLTNMIYAQLGLSQKIFDGTATEEEMLNYYNRTVEPILAAITDEMTRKFLTKTARTQHHIIKFFRDPFKLAPVNQIAEIADKFTRNEILSSNEVRSIIGYKPVNDARADELRNKNLNVSNEEVPPMQVNDEYSEDEYGNYGNEENYDENYEDET